MHTTEQQITARVQEVITRIQSFPSYEDLARQLKALDEQLGQRACETVLTVSQTGTGG